jgi:signal transduction histidine kinase
MQKGQVQYTLSNWVDISEQKSMEDKIVDLYFKERLQREELQEEAKSRGLFINVLAHELRTPLTPILISTEMLRDLSDVNDLDNTQDKLIKNICTSAQVLSKRLEELLDVARFSRGMFKLHLQPVEPVSFVKGVVSRFISVINQRGQQLEVELPMSLPMIEADPSRLEQVIINLLSNASKFSIETGRIILRVNHRAPELLFEVQDNGKGISSEDQARLFNPYHRVEQDRQQFPGLGLGLAVARQIVESHGGKIWLNSQPGVGSTFYFNIPLKQGENQNN